MRNHYRFRVLVDPKVQGSLCLRVVLYWFCCQLTLLLALGCIMALRQPPASSEAWFGQVWTQYGVALLASLLVLPLLMVDCLIITNRFVGPMRRLLKAMNKLADGQPVHPIQFRSGDFWEEFADAFNRIASREPVSSVDYQTDDHAISQVGS